MKTKLAPVLAFGAAVCCISLVAFAADKPEPTATEKPPTKRRVVYQVPKTSIHYCTDQQEAQRRWTATKEMTTADVFRFTGPAPSRRLDPITHVSPIREFGGGTDAEPSQFGIDVTDAEDKSIRDAIDKGELFIIYYHYGW